VALHRERQRAALSRLEWRGEAVDAVIQALVVLGEYGAGDGDARVVISVEREVNFSERLCILVLDHFFAAQEHVARLGGYYDLRYYRRCDHLIANTRDIVDYIVRSGWAAERVHYLPNFAARPPTPAGLNQR
jgi:hypothetical protein